MNLKVEIQKNDGLVPASRALLDLIGDDCSEILSRVRSYGQCDDMFSGNRCVLAENRYKNKHVQSINTNQKKRHNECHT